MTYRIGFDGVASAEVTHMLRAVQKGLNGAGANLLTHVQAEDAASGASTVCIKDGKLCDDGKAPVEPPNVVVIHTALLATIVVISALAGVAFGFGLGRKSVNAIVGN